MRQLIQTIGAFLRSLAGRVAVRQLLRAIGAFLRSLMARKKPRVKAKEEGPADTTILSASDLLGLDREVLSGQRARIQELIGGFYSGQLDITPGYPDCEVPFALTTVSLIARSLALSRIPPHDFRGMEELFFRQMHMNRTAERFSADITLDAAEEHIRRHGVEGVDPELLVCVRQRQLQLSL